MEEGPSYYEADEFKGLVEFWSQCDENKTYILCKEMNVCFRRMFQNNIVRNIYWGWGLDINDLNLSKESRTLKIYILGAD